MTVEKTSEAGCESRDYGSNPSAVIEGQRVEVRDKLIGYHQLRSAIEALFGGKEARHKALASFPPGKLDGLQRMVGQNGQDSLHKAIIYERNKAFAKQVEALGFEVKIIYPDTARGVFLIKRDKEVSEEELLREISPIAQNMGIKAQLTTSRMDIAGERHITVAFEDPNTD